MKNRKKLISLMAGLLAAAMLLTLLVGILPVSAAAKSSSEIKSEISSLKGEQADIQDQLKDLEAEQDATWESIEEMVQQKNNIDQQIGLLYADIDLINEQIRSYTELIAANQEELDIAERNLQELTDQNAERIQAMEEEGKVSVWSVIFKAKSFSDLIDRLNMMQEIQEADERRMDALREAAEVVNLAREELTSEKANLEQSRTELKEQQAKLDEKRVEAEELLAQLTADKRTLDQLEAEYEADEAKLSAEIAAAELEYTKALEKEKEALAGASDAPTANAAWKRPCSWRKLTSPYGYRTHPTTGQWKFHSGVDLANDKGTPIKAARSGTVTVATYGSSYGYYVTINHGDGFSSLYAHMTHYVVSRGEYVEQGQVIGYMGSTGRSTGPHLHFSIFYNGSSVNPMNYI